MLVNIISNILAYAIILFIGVVVLILFPITIPILVWMSLSVSCNEGMPYFFRGK